MRFQRIVDLLAVAALALLALSGYLTWVSADPGNGRKAVDFNGYTITKAPVTLALAGVVAVVVLKLAGTVLRRVLGGLVVLLGIAAIAVSLGVRPDGTELSRLRPELSDVVANQVTLTLGPAPWLALTGGIALVAAGLLVVLTAHRWRRATQRYERDPAATPADQWKAIDAGEDPTL
ncbi:Trp biosynthesis-associated membrane protein [Kribbella sp.]|uniref:Trp biosynthesis-associated membrane protein n=1 Tax=Kribbella sp. TaxID=1871183 RepID=UPI002D2EB3BA|nr:Trp biosynthesis-associated membrane protein [Kribbella sp.]HZX09149.1 Trp biosynthesis-associated membrane protein [Kribbella sp.]